jgi:type II secretory ATPase GspE/PulE/Tfp pilus assembly ATPase PilB-like protein
LELDEVAREKVMARASASEIVQVAKHNGVRLLRDDGWLKVRQGVTTPEEVTRSTKM